MSVISSASDSEVVLPQNMELEDGISVASDATVAEQLNSMQLHVSKNMRRRLTPCRRRRFKKARAEGKTAEQAMAEALKNCAPDGMNRQGAKSSKRNRSGEDKNDSTKTAAKKTKDTSRTSALETDRAGGSSGNMKPTVKKPRRTFSAVVSAVKVGIVPTDYPRRRLTPAEINDVRNSILKLIAEQRNVSKVKPRFVQNPIARYGWLEVHCQDESTAEWVKGQGQWQKFKCQTVDASNFPKENFVMGHFRHSAKHSTVFMLEVLEGQNQFKTDTWKEDYRKDEGTLAKIVFSVDNQSMLALEKAAFVVQFGFGQQVKLKRLTNYKGEEDRTPIGTEGDRDKPITESLPIEQPSTTTPKAGVELPTLRLRTGQSPPTPTPRTTIKMD